MIILFKLLPLILLLISCQTIKSSRTPQAINVEQVKCSFHNGFGVKFNKISFSSADNIIMETYPGRALNELEETCNFIELMNIYAKKQKYPLVINEDYLSIVRKSKPLELSSVFSNLYQVQKIVGIEYFKGSPFLLKHHIVFMDDESVIFKAENKGLQMYVNGEPFFHLKMKRKKAKENAEILSLKVSNLNKLEEFLVFAIAPYSADNHDASKVISTTKRFKFEHPISPYKRNKQYSDQH